MKLPIRDIRLDCGTQSRASLNQDTINQYAEDMTEGAVFPPPVVFYDGEKYILSVGFHRVHAALQAGFQDMECEVRNGTLRDAILFSIKSNADHGLPRTNADKKHAVKMAFQQLMEDGRNIRDVDDVSHTEVAKMAAVHRQYVLSVRGDIEKELLGDVRIGQPNTITPKSKQTSGEDTQRLKDELARLRAEKEALAERERMEVQSRVKAEGELMSIRNQYEHLLESARKEQSKKVEYITPPDVEDELETLRLENSRIAAALEEAKKNLDEALQNPLTIEVEKEVFVTPPEVTERLRELETDLSIAKERAERLDQKIKEAKDAGRDYESLLQKKMDLHKSIDELLKKNDLAEQERKWALVVVNSAREIRETLNRHKGIIEEALRKGVPAWANANSIRECAERCYEIGDLLSKVVETVDIPTGEEGEYERCKLS